MLNGMSTIEMIENLKIEIWPKIGWYDGSDDRRWNDIQPQTPRIRDNTLLKPKRH